ncbi:hypothetical protein, partial [Vibrio sp. M260118]|uniref:hypothetical protein n=1 Tax=Vibrio sp. M260118 TaxID=3020896 RepID=UPI002F42518E
TVTSVAKSSRGKRQTKLRYCVTLLAYKPGIKLIFTLKPLFSEAFFMPDSSRQSGRFNRNLVNSRAYTKKGQVFK